MDRRPVTAPNRIAQFLEQFLKIEAASGVVLLIATALALFWANSPWSASYEHLWHAAIFGATEDPHATLHFFVNDGLMTIFFLVVGLEIRREIHDGALSTLRLAALPIAAAVGGIVAPAIIYTLLNGDPAVRQGWAIPTPTDIAFAVGVLALLGNRVDPALRVLLLALAIADDIAAILVIALVYADGFAPAGLGLAAAGVVGMLALVKLRIERALPYLALGAVVWLGLLKAGFHPVLAGVILGLLLPVKSATSQQEEGERATDSPAARLEHALHPWVAYGIMPLFALANAGVGIGAVDFASTASISVGTGIILGLVVGKPLGIVGVTAFAVRMRWCELPRGVSWYGIAVVGCLGGIGFTMSIFIAALAFTDAQLLAVAKFAVLLASALAATLGLLAGRWLLPMLADR
jgi:NhaA family Na+:H+ antiporter